MGVKCGILCYYSGFTTTEFNELRKLFQNFNLKVKVLVKNDIKYGTFVYGPVFYIYTENPAYLNNMYNKIFNLLLKQQIIPFGGLIGNVVYEIKNFEMILREYDYVLQNNILQLTQKKVLSGTWYLYKQLHSLLYAIKINNGDINAVNTK
jgi:hypothetical protein